jgi:hypothetical protein
MGYNWQSTLGDSAAISGILAGFSFAFIVFVLPSSAANTRLVCDITWGNISVLLNGIAGVLFVISSELFVSAKQFDIWSIPDMYKQHLEDGLKKDGKEWKDVREETWQNCRLYEGRGRKVYNVAIFVLFLATGFIIGPYNIVIAVLVSGLGIGLELYQMRKA